MNITKSNPYGKLSEKRLGEFEMRIGARLPEDYRQFLLEHNGALVGNLWFADQDGDYVGDADGYFYGIYDEIPEEQARDLEREHAGNAGYLPPGCLAITDDCCGNYACIVYDGEQRGQVLFFDHETDGGCETHELRHVADTFQGFLNQLQEHQDEHAEAITPPDLFPVFVKTWRVEGNLPSALLPSGHKELFGYLAVGPEKKMSLLPENAVPVLLDVLVAGLTEDERVSDEFVYGGAEDSIEFFLPGSQRITIGIAREPYFMNSGSYWKSRPETWSKVRQFSNK